MILMYHSVADYTDDHFLVTVRPRTFERQLEWLRRRGLRGVSVAALLAARERGTARGLVGLTFDDGYRDFVAEALPRLVRRGFTATVFPVAGRLGGFNGWEDRGPVKPLLTAADLVRARDAGMEIGSHGLTHTPLPGRCAAELGAEVAGSREELAALVGDGVTGFCYPYGLSDAACEQAVRAAGYEYGCSILPARPGPHCLPRTYVGDRDGGLRLAAKFLRTGSRDRKAAATP